jgi:hypothetical protein
MEVPCNEVKTTFKFSFASGSIETCVLCESLIYFCQYNGLVLIGFKLNLIEVQFSIVFIIASSSEGQFVRHLASILCNRYIQ